MDSDSPTSPAKKARTGPSPTEIPPAEQPSIEQPNTEPVAHEADSQHPAKPATWQILTQKHCSDGSTQETFILNIPQVSGVVPSFEINISSEDDYYCKDNPEEVAFWQLCHNAVFHYKSGDFTPSEAEALSKIWKGALTEEQIAAAMATTKTTPKEAQKALMATGDADQPLPPLSFHGSISYEIVL